MDTATGTVLFMRVWITDIPVSDGKCNDHSLLTSPNVEDGAGRLLRLDSSVDMKLGDLGGMVLYYTCICLFACLFVCLFVCLFDRSIDRLLPGQCSIVTVVLSSVVSVCDLSVCQHHNSWTIKRYHHKISGLWSKGQTNSKMAVWECLGREKLSLDVLVCCVLVWDRGIMTRPISDQCHNWSWSCSFSLGLGFGQTVIFFPK